MLRLMIRGYIAGVKQFEEPVNCTPGDDLELLVTRQVANLCGKPGGYFHMIEIEFLDEPDPMQRYFRVGTDPEMMVIPMEIIRPGPPN